MLPVLMVSNLSDLHWVWFCCYIKESLPSPRTKIFFLLLLSINSDSLYLIFIMAMHCW